MALEGTATAITMTSTMADAPSVTVPGDDAPVKIIDRDQMRVLGQNLFKSFETYRRDRRIQELRWLRNLRQYLGFYDPDVETRLAANRSRAYPKMTRVKCISMLARIMDLMFPSDDRNWTISARPSADMDINDVMSAIQDRQKRDQAAGQQPPSPLTKDYVTSAVQELATKRAQDLSIEIDDQLEELGGDQSYDYIQLNNEVVAGGILYGIGMLVGPYVREMPMATWDWDEQTQQPVASQNKKYMPQYDFLSVWDFYPDLSAKRIEDMDGHFVRKVMSKKQVRDLGKRSDFFENVIKDYLSMNGTGNYKPQEFETELRSMGVKANVNDQQANSMKYEVIIWHGPIDAQMLEMAGVDVPQDKRADMIDAEVWMIDNYVIKASMNPWSQLGVDVRTLHPFIFDRDDTAPIGFGLPNVLRDTQMSIAAATRMMMDNASVVCGPIVEMNTNLLRADQDLTGLYAYRTFYRDDDGQSAQYPAIREIKVESHIDDLLKVIDLFMKLADIETFVGPATGGDMSKMPSEPMRNAAGASMLMGSAALPFKQIIRNFDKFTKSVMQSLVQFNRQFNPGGTPEADYDVIARGATSLIAKEVRGMQVDQLAASLKPEEAMHVDMRKLVEARFRVRDLADMLVSEAEAAQRQSMQDQATQLDKQLQQAGIEASTRNLLSQAFKNIAQGQANQARGQAEAVNSAITVLEKGAALSGHQIEPQSQGGGAGAPLPAVAGGPAASPGLGAVAGLGGAGAVQAPGMQPPGVPPGPGGM